MDDERAIAVIRRLILDREHLIAAVKRKRWRDSEKATTIANYREQMYALDRALGALQYRIDNKPKPIGEALGPTENIGS